MSNAGWYNQGNRGSGLSDLAVAANEDGRLEVFSYENSGYTQVLHKWQDAPNGNWGGWAALPVVADQRYLSMFLAGHTNVFVGLLHNNALWLVTESGWSTKQTAPNGGWTNWARVEPQGMPDSLLPTAVMRAMNGKLVVVGVDQDPNKYDIMYTSEQSPNGPWVNWGHFGHPQNWAAYSVRADDWAYRSRVARLKRTSEAVGANRDGRLQFFAASPHSVFGRYQTQQGGDSPWSGWLDLGAPPNLENNADLTVIQNDDGHLEVFAVGTNPSSPSLDYRWWHLWQNGPDAGWTNSNWTQLAGGPPVAYWPNAEPAKPERPTLKAARNAPHGCIQLFAIGPQGDVIYTSQAQPNGGWTGVWKSLGGEAVTAMDVAQNADGRLEVFIISDGSLLHRWQTQVGVDNWSTVERH